MDSAENLRDTYGTLGVIGMRGCEELAAGVDHYLKTWRRLELDGHDSYIVHVSNPRFGTGEAKGMIAESVRGNDLYILSDVFNYGVTFNMYGREIPMSPDNHFQDLKRIVSAAAGRSRRINVIMPMLYEGRQHRRSARESLDCALALQELVRMGVKNIITFDAHDPRVSNSIPLAGFEDIRVTYQMIKALFNAVPDIDISPEKLMIISPDEGGMGRCIYYSSVLGVNLGMFYKRRNYSVIVNGRNPIVAHEFLGDNVSGKDVIIVDDMIASGDSILDISDQVRAMGARRVFVFATFGLFAEGLSRFDEAYQKGKLDRVFTTNLVYQTPDLLSREWYTSVNMCKYLAYIIDTLNRDQSISSLLNPIQRINNLLVRKGFKPHVQPK